ncbi:MAG TPA: hypothetical protein PK770_06715 [Kiritimatiellia bacterium]|nr:hypothetical protein [Kiritimatiellia bacterium]
MKKYKMNGTVTRQNNGTETLSNQAEIGRLLVGESGEYFKQTRSPHFLWRRLADSMPHSGPTLGHLF